MNVVEFRNEDLSNSMLLLGFPGRGFVGPVAAAYLVERLRLTRFAGLYGETMEPIAIVHEGIAYSPVRFYSGKARCGPGGACDRLIVGLADEPIPLDVINNAARAILTWAKRRGVALVVILEGFAETVGPPSGPVRGKNVLGVKSAHSRQDFERWGVAPVAGGSLSSHAAALLLAANELKMDVLGLFARTRPEGPDPRASGLLLRKVDPMLPNLSLAPAELEERAAELDLEMRDSVKASRQQLKSLRKSYEMMYQ